MKGYSNMKQYISDFKIYQDALRMEPERRSGETLSTIMKARIKQGLDKATASFKNSMIRNGFSDFDLLLIGIHDDIDEVYDLNYFLHNVPVKNKDWIFKLKMVLRSRAYRTGRLQKLKQLLPKRLDCKDDLVRFIKENSHLSHEELCMICNSATRKNWKKWLFEAQQEKLIAHLSRGWQ